MKPKYMYYIILIILLAVVFYFFNKAQKIQVSNRTFSVYSLQMTVPKKWYVEKQENNKIYIKTDYKPYRVYLVANAEEMPQDWLKDARITSEASLPRQHGEDLYVKKTPIETGSIFEIDSVQSPYSPEAAWIIARTGIVAGKKNYKFTWTIDSTEKEPAIRTMQFFPQNNVTGADIWEIMNHPAASSGVSP